MNTCPAMVMGNGVGKAIGRGLVEPVVSGVEVASFSKITMADRPLADIIDPPGVRVWSAMT